MEDVKNFTDIPKEMFEFANKKDIAHDKKLETKPVSYLKGAFQRFCKNKGSVVAAVIILCLVLFAIIVPFCTPYTVKYQDTYFETTYPKSKLFANTDFWDGCYAVRNNRTEFLKDFAMGQETGHNTVKNQKYTVGSDGLYEYRRDSYQENGVVYMTLTLDKYKSLQDYQNATGKQVIYPTVKDEDRPKAQAANGDGNYYYKTEGTNRTTIVTDGNGNVIPVYWEYVDGTFDDGYDSIRIKADENGFINKEGQPCHYAYAKPMGGDNYECRVNYYEYYIYFHTMVEKDGITEPCFLFGTTAKDGQDILTCLASGARFSFLFAIAVALVNMFVGAIYGAIEGYYGGKIDIFMERIADILSAVPFMIVITLLQLHMGTASNIVVLFVAFFLTGWIGMAGRTRMQFYRFKNQEYVLAARTLGARDRRLMWKHIFPNAIGTLITSCALVIPSMIFSEANLSYLGIINLSSGDITSVGTLITAGQQALGIAPFVAIFPSVFLVLLMLSFNLFGNGLRDAFNPSLRGSE